MQGSAHICRHTSLSHAWPYQDTLVAGISQQGALTGVSPLPALNFSFGIAQKALSERDSKLALDPAPGWVRITRHWLERCCPRSGVWTVGSHERYAGTTRELCYDVPGLASRRGRTWWVKLRPHPCAAGSKIDLEEGIWNVPALRTHQASVMRLCPLRMRAL